MMKRNASGKRFALFALLSALVIMPLAAYGQTPVKMPKNKYKVQDDVELGRKAAGQVDREFPILNDADATRYVEQVGRRLVAAIPSQFQQQAFNYRFKVVNARDINAFALPGGPMYVNRGMIEAARNEGEMAGVMAHEISHVALRHATAQQTKLNNPLNQILGIGAIIGGGILAGQAGAQAGQVVAAGYFLKYSRDYEKQADILGAQIMANAGYDPRDLANMFQTIEKQSGGGRAPEWLSSHPNPGNRYEAINREASLLRVNGTPIKITRDFERVQGRLRGMPKARSMEEIERNSQNNQTQSPTAGGRYSNSVAYPSNTTRLYSSGSLFRASVPSNWRDFISGTDSLLAPEGAYGDQGITHGAMFGTYTAGTGGLSQASTEYVNGVLQGNNYLRQRGGLMRTTVGGRNGYTTVLAGLSPVTGKTEVVTLYTTQLNTGELFYIATVVPEIEAGRYSTAFRTMVSSLRITE